MRLWGTGLMIAPDSEPNRKVPEGINSWAAWRGRCILTGSQVVGMLPALASRLDATRWLALLRSSRGRADFSEFNRAAVITPTGSLLAQGRPFVGQLRGESLAAYAADRPWIVPLQGLSGTSERGGIAGPGPLSQANDDRGLGTGHYWEIYRC